MTSVAEFEGCINVVSHGNSPWDTLPSWMSSGVTYRLAKKKHDLQNFHFNKQKIFESLITNLLLQVRPTGTSKITRKVTYNTIQQRTHHIPTDHGRAYNRKEETPG
jgi:hypothetical protein